MEFQITNQSNGIIFQGSNISAASRECGVSATYLRKMIIKNAPSAFEIKKGEFSISFGEKKILSFEDVLLPIMNAYSDHYVNFFLPNIERWIQEYNDWYVKASEIQREIMSHPFGSRERNIAAREGRIWQDNNKIGGNHHIALKLEKKNEEERKEYVRKMAEEKFIKRSQTIIKNLQSKGLNLQSLIKADLFTSGSEFEIWFEDAEGNKAHARTILAWGPIKAPHIRFICR